MVDVIYIRAKEQVAMPPVDTEYSNILCQEFRKWLLLARPGEKFCYYFGPYICGQLVGRKAMDAYEAGRVLLYQKKEGEKYGYWAQRK